jgi:tripartite-type tricarboxylate transporter receptor subunit TctC
VAVSRFMGISTAKGVPKEVRTILIEAFKKGMANEEFKKFILQTGQIPVFVSGEEASVWIRNQGDQFKIIAGRIGIKPD